MRRWLWLHLTPNGRYERAAVQRYWRNTSVTRGNSGETVDTHEEPQTDTH